MENLPNDLLLVIANKLDFNSIIEFSSINKINFKLFDDKFFEELAYIYYSVKFWEKAKNRPIYNSIPLKSFKLELLRIENFQKYLDDLNINRWTKKDFYNYWSFKDKYLYNQNNM